MPVKPSPETRQRLIRVFTHRLAWLAIALTLVPYLIGVALAPAGSSFTGHVYNFDDHMVYAGWMQQSMEGRLLFENRFAVEEQPRLTLHLYFLVLGWIAKVVGVSTAAVLAQLGFGYLAILMMGRLMERARWDIFRAKFALVIAVFGAGLGYLFWQNFGVAIAGEPNGLALLTNGFLPIDVFQPEVFFFPSMLTNGLFMASLCLILTILGCILAARKSWKPVLPGFVASLLLMNIHSYDSLLITLVLIGFVVMLAASRQLTKGWLVRGTVIMLGALPPALWFLYVLRQDAVFQSRAATETFAATFPSMVVGLLPALLFSAVALAKSPITRQFKLVGGSLVGTWILILYGISYQHGGGSFLLDAGLWGALYIIVIGSLVLLRQRDPIWNLLLAWALIGLIAPYFPGLFQRKLAMMLMIPWAFLAAIGVETVLRQLDRNARNLTSALMILLFCATSLLWLQRHLSLVRANVSNTTVHAVYLSRDMQEIIRMIRAEDGSPVILAMPGVASPATNSAGEPTGEFDTPYIPDLNPVMVGYAGATAFAGHWSETPNYMERRNAVTRFFLAPTRRDEREALIDEIDATFVVAPNPSAFPEINLGDMRPYGEVLYEGNQFWLIRLRR